MPDYLLIDGCDTIDWPCPQQSVIHGDGTSYSIAAASVLAKVYRDRLLVELDGPAAEVGIDSAAVERGQFFFGMGDVAMVEDVNLRAR